MIQVSIPAYVRSKRALLQEINLRFPAGRFSVILGPNGAGKSTLLRLMSGQEPLQTGHVLLADESVASMALLTRAQRLAMLTQDHPLNFPFSAMEVVKMGTHPLGVGEEEAVLRAVDLLKTMELSDLSTRNYLTLSGGEKQRVQLARVIAQVGPETQLLLLDEPLSGMDLRHQHLTLAYLQALARSGLTVVAVLHDPVLAARYADQLVMLKNGQLHAQGAVESVWNAHALSTLYDLPLDVSFHEGEPQLRTSGDNFFRPEPL